MFDHQIADAAANMTPSKTELLHWSAGRTRLKNRELRDTPGLAQRIESALRMAPGIRNAKVSRITSSLLIEYDPSAWREPQGTRQFWAALCSLFPASCQSDGCAVPVGDLTQRPQVREAFMQSFLTAPGVTEARYDSSSQQIQIRFDPERFALGPVVQALTRFVES